MQFICASFRVKNLFFILFFVFYSFIVSSQVINRINIDDDNMRILLNIKVGEKFTPNMGVKTIKTLYRTGFYSNIKLLKNKNADGTIDITVKLTRKIVFTKPVIRGKHKVKQKKINHFLALNRIEDTEYNEKKFEEYLKLFNEYLHSLGFPDAELIYKLQLDKVNSEITLIIKINYGEPIIIKKINTNCKVLEKNLGLKVGEVFDENQLKHDIERSKIKLIEKKYYQAKFDKKIEISNKSAIITVNVNKGSIFNYNISHFSLTKQEKNKVFRFFKRGNLDKFSINYIKKNLEHIAMLKGYYNPKFSVKIKENSLYCDFINPQKKQIKKVFQESSFKLNLTEMKYYNALTKGIIYGKVNELLKSKGYNNSQINISFDTVKSNVYIKIKVGKTVTIDEIILNKPKNLDIDMLKELKQGSIYSESIINKFMAKLKNVLKQKGYYNFKLSFTKEKIDKDKVLLTINIVVAEPKFLKEIYIYGLKKIQKSTVLNFIKFKQGDIFRAQDIAVVKDRLYSSSYFSEVIIEVFETVGNDLILFIKLKEKKMYSISYGFGGNSDEGLRIFGSIKKSYLMNRNLTGTMFVRNSDKKSQLYLSINGRHGFLSTLYYIFDDKSEYQFSKIGLSTSYAFKYRNGKTLIAGVDFKKSNLNNVSVPEEEIEKEHFPNYTGKLFARFLLDKRDDILYPSKGFFLDLKFEPSYDFDFGAKYFKAMEKSAFYYKGFAFSQTIGTIFSKDSKFTKTPIPERFFSGGASTLRISSFEKAGPLFSNGTPKGGDFLALFTAEYRFMFTETIGGTVFVDIGNVWSDVKYASFESSVKDTGIGIWYKTPLGPIKLELAFNLDKDTFSTKKRLVFSIGHTF